MDNEDAELSEQIQKKILALLNRKFGSTKVYLDEEDIIRHIPGDYGPITIKRALESLTEKGEVIRYFSRSYKGISIQEWAKRKELPSLSGHLEVKTYYALLNKAVEKGLVCRYCNSPNIVEDQNMGESYCNDCGAVLDTRIQVPDWKDVNPPIDLLYADNSHDTFLKKKTYRRRAQVYERVYTKEEKHLRKMALPEFQLAFDNLGTPKQIRRQALLIYLIAYRNGINVKNIGCKPYIHAAIELAYRSKRIAYRGTIYYGPSWRNRVIFALKRMLDISDIGAKIDARPFSAFEYMPYLASVLGEYLKGKEYVVSEATKLLKKANSSIWGKNPRLVATAAIYAVSRKYKVHICLREIAEAADVSHTRVCELSRVLQAFLD